MADPYVSHPVRRMREDPTGEDVTLVVDVAAEDSDDPAVDRVADALADIGTVEDRLRFGSLRVTVPQARLDEVCSLDGIETVETAATRSLSGDAGEDVDPT